MASDGTEQTRVGHCKADETDVYVGRGPNGSHMHNTLVGNRGWLGNPFTVEEYGREKSIRKFRTEFEKLIDTNPVFADAVAELSGKTLGCWCQRLVDEEPACHAEIIAEFADRLHQSQDAETDRGQVDE